MRRTLLAVAACLFAQAADAQNFETRTDTSGVRGTPVEQPLPPFPGGDIRTGQEGWVRLHFIVSTDGRTVDPIVIDSVGGETFERAALATLAEWRFEPPEDGRDIGNNVVDMRFEIHRGRDLATANFLRRYRRIVTHLHHEETDAARAQVDQAVELGGWNLYESTMLNLMLGRVEGQEGDLQAKLEYYRRALGVGNRAALDGEDRRDLLKRIFEAEVESGQYGSAIATAGALAAEPNSQADHLSIADELARITSAVAGDDDLVAKAAVAQSCACEASEPVWQYRPARQSFRVDNPSGTLARFEARCDAVRLAGEVRPGERVELPDGAQNCRVFVFGERGVTFDFVEPGASRRRQADLTRKAVAIR